nr:unnamed protein product [Digitaria exilis]
MLLGLRSCSSPTGVFLFTPLPLPSQSTPQHGRRQNVHIKIVCSALLSSHAVLAGSPCARRLPLGVCRWAPPPSSSSPRPPPPPRMPPPTAYCRRSPPSPPPPPKTTTTSSIPTSTT